MNIGKLGEGVYLLTIGPSGRTIKPAKMAKVVKKTQQQENVSEFPVKDWWTAAEVAIELGIARQKIYGNNSALSQYISRPDGKHFLYHRDLFEDKQAVAMLKGMPQLPAARQQNSAKIQNVEPVVCEEKKPVEVAAATEATNRAEPAETSAEAQPIVVNRKVYCKELDRTFDSVTDGAKAIGTRRESLSKALRAGQRCRGYTFTYVDKEHEAPVHRKEKKVPTGCAVPKKVFCVDLNRAFNSLQEGAEAIGSTASALSAALRYGHRCKGHIFKYVDDPQRPDAQTRPVYCRELDKIFPSVTAAAKAVNRSVSTMISAIEKNYLCGGYHFAYA